MADYDEIAEFYFNRRKDRTRFDFNRDIEVPALIKMLGNVKDKKILDVGCGFGDHAKHLSKKGFRELQGFDLSSKSIEIANRQKIPRTNFFTGDMEKKFPFNSNTFDIVYASLSIHYVENIAKLFREINRVMKKGGIFVFSTAHPIFNLMNQTEEHVIGARKMEDGTRLIWGNYFDESYKESDLGSLGKIKLYNFTYETLIRSGLNAGFELVDYIDARPVPQSKKIDEDKYRLTTTLPSIILFKFRKK